MSLDVYLLGRPKEETCVLCGSKYSEKFELYWGNITHNLGKMAHEAGIYKHLWRPEELGLTKAGQLIDGLKLGLSDLKTRPDYFKQFDAENGWGLYEHFVPFVQKYLDACILYPESEIRVSR